MSSEVLNSTTMYDPPLRHSRTLSRASMNSQQTEELLPRYPTAAPLSTQTSTETLRGPPQKSEEVKKQLGEGGQLSVDGFVYEIERVQYDLSTVKSGLERLSTLYDQALAVAPSTSSRCATTNKLHADLSDCTNTVRETFAPLPAALRTLSTRVMYLRGGGGRAFVLAAEAAENKTRIADAARIMKECVTLIDAGIAKGARVEAAERKTAPGTMRNLDNPFREIKEAYLATSGAEGMSFLSKIDTSIKLATSYASWLNPLAYSYSLPSYSAAGPADDKQDDQDIPLLKQDEEDGIGNFGKKLAKDVRPYSKVRLALILSGLLIMVGTVTAGGIVWMKQGDHPTAS